MIQFSEHSSYQKYMTLNFSITEINLHVTPSGDVNFKLMNS